MSEQHYGVEVLHWAGMSEIGLDNLQDIFFTNPELINFENRYGENALHIACRVNNLDTVEWLIKKTNINYQKVVDQGNALLIAIANNNNTIAEYLLNNSDINYKATTNKNQTIYHLLARNGNDNLIEHIMKIYPEGINFLDKNSQHCLFDFIYYFSSHKKYYLYDTLQENMEHDIFIKENNDHRNLLQVTELLLDDYSTEIEKNLKEELYAPLLNILKCQF